jgi:hypothetical protein
MTNQAEYTDDILTSGRHLLSLINEPFLTSLSDADPSLRDDLGSKLFLTPVTLKDGSEMIYPFLVGRSALGGFLIDPSRSRAARPTCPPDPFVLSQLQPQRKE